MSVTITGITSAPTANVITGPGTITISGYGLVTINLLIPQLQDIIYSDGTVFGVTGGGLLIYTPRILSFGLGGGPFAPGTGGEIVGSPSGGYKTVELLLDPARPLFTAGPETVNFNQLTTDQQAALTAGRYIYNGLGGNDVVTLPDKANYNESIGSGLSLGWTNTPASTFYTGSRVGDTYTVNGGDGDYSIVEGAGTEFITINGGGRSTIYAGSGTDNIAINGDGDSTVVAGSGTGALSISGGGKLEILGNFTGSATIQVNSTVEVDNSFASGGTVNFASTSPAMLILDDPAGFNGVITGFSRGDTIDLPGIPLPLPNNNAKNGLDAHFDPATGVLDIDTVRFGSGVPPSIDLALSFSGIADDQTFALTSDGSGGTAITSGVPEPDVVTLAELSNDTYSTPVAIGNYSPVVASPINLDGFFGEAYQDGNQIVVAFRGTELFDPGATVQNILADLSFFGDAKMPDSALVAEVQDAANFLQIVRKDYPNDELTITGHSLGGAIAQLIGQASGYTTVAFDAPGTGNFQTSQFNLAPAMDGGDGTQSTDTNYRLQGDQVSLAGKSVGGQVTVASPNPDDPANIVNNHSLTTLIDQIYNGAPDVVPDLPLTDTELVEKSIIRDNAVSTAFSASAGVVSGPFYAIDPSGYANYQLVGDSNSPGLSAIYLPAASNVAMYDISFEDAGDNWSEPQSISPNSTIAAPTNVGAIGVDFTAEDINGNPVVVPSNFVFEISFSSAGTFNGTLTESVTCYCHGTSILTARGKIRVEDLTVNDLVQAERRALPRLGG